MSLMENSDNRCGRKGQRPKCTGWRGRTIQTRTRSSGSLNDSSRVGISSSSQLTATRLLLLRHRRKKQSCFSRYWGQSAPFRVPWKKIKKKKQKWSLNKGKWTQCLARLKTNGPKWDHQVVNWAGSAAGVGGNLVLRGSTASFVKSP